MRCVIGGEIPNNAGSLSTIKVTAPAGSILNAPHPCAVTARHVIGQMLPDVVLGCLGQAIPNRVPAEGTSCLWNPVLLSGHGLTETQAVPDDQPFAMNTFHAGGNSGQFVVVVPERELVVVRLGLTLNESLADMNALLADVLAAL